MVSNNSLAQKIYEILYPLLGPAMAQATLKIHSRKIGASEEALAITHLSAIAVSIGKAMSTIIGIDRANEATTLIQKIKGEK
jgi:hypothetical protein